MDDQQVGLPHAQSTEEAAPVKDDTNITSNSPSGGGDGGSLATGISCKPTCTEPHPNDVLCGRGEMTNQHVGNAHWRSLVAANKRLYVKLPKRQKVLVSESIVKAVRSQDPPGRFLKLDQQTKVWTDVGDRRAISKTSQALKEGAFRLRGKMIAEETSSIASSLPYSESDAASVMSSSVASVSDLMAAGAGQNQVPGEESTSASAQTPLAGNLRMEPQSLAQVIATPNVNAGVTAAGALTEQQRVQQVLTQQEQQTMMPPPPPRLPQQPQQAQPQSEIPRLPQQLQQAQPQNMQQPFPQPQPEIPVQEQLQSPAQIQYQISQIAFLLKQLEMQIQSQGMQITPLQQAQYAFLMQQQQTLAQMFFLAQQQEQLALQMMQQSVGGNNTAPSTMAGVASTAADTLDEAKVMQPPLPALNGQEQQLRRRSSGLSSPIGLLDMMRTGTLGTFGMASASDSLGSLANFDESDGKLPASEDMLDLTNSNIKQNGRAQTQEENSAPSLVGMAAAAASANADDQQKQNGKPTPGSKAQKRLSQEDFARWSRVKAMLAKTSSIGTGDTNAAHVSHPGSIHGQSSGAAAPLPAAASAAGADAHDAPTRNQPQTSLNRDVSMMSTFSGLSGIISVGEAGNFGLERGDTRGNGAVDVTDMVTRNISAAMSEMSQRSEP